MNLRASIYQLALSRDKDGYLTDALQARMRALSSDLTTQ
jgi:hypothetical protein